MIFFTADTHFNHTNVLAYCKRPFATVQEMNEEIIKRWNSVVTSDDDVFHLGDIGLGIKKELTPLVQQLNGRKVLICGNHDYDFRLSQILEMGFHGVMGKAIFQNRFVLSHYPYEGDTAEEDRYQHMRPKRGQMPWLLHGHVHDLWHVKGDMINVGMDVNNFTPVSLDDILALIDRQNELINEEEDD